MTSYYFLIKMNQPDTNQILNDMALKHISETNWQHQLSVITSIDNQEAVIEVMNGGQNWFDSKPWKDSSTFNVNAPLNNDSPEIILFKQTRQAAIDAILGG